MSVFVLAWNGEDATRPTAPQEARRKPCPREMATQTQNPAYRVASQTEKARASYDARAFFVDIHRARLTGCSAAEARSPLGSQPPQGLPVLAVEKTIFLLSPVRNGPAKT